VRGAPADTSLTKNVEIIASVAVGKGTIAPYKMLVRPGTQGTELLIITGQGESFGMSVLHLVDYKTLKDKRPDLNLCGNASSFIVPSADFAVVVCRGSKELVVVDLVRWRVAAQLQLNFAPIAVAMITRDRVAVSSVFDGEVCLIAVHIDAAGILRCKDVRLQSYALAADPARHVIYDTVPDFGIFVLDDRTLDILKAVPVKGTPSFGAVVWNSKLLFTDREGYLWIMDASGRLQSLDLTAILGLDRTKLPPRGIDPTDILPLDHHHITVVSGRQNSIVLTVQGKFPRLRFSRLSFLPSGIYGIFDRLQATVFITIPSSNKIVSVWMPIPLISGLYWKTQKFTVGDIIEYAVHLDHQGMGMVATIDSDNNLTLVTYHGVLAAQSIRLKDFRPIGPLTSGPDNTLLVIGNYHGDYSLLQINLDGQLLQHYALTEFNSIFSISRRGRHVLLVDRLAGKFGILDLDSGKLVIQDSVYARPRAGLLFNDRRMMLIHDTNPNIGYSLWRDGKMSGFVSTAWLAGYPTDIATVDGRVAVISFFGGNIINVNPVNNDILHHVSMPDEHLMSLSVCTAGAMWANSSDFDASDYFIANEGVLEAAGRISIPGLDYIFPLQSTHCAPEAGVLLWAVTDKNVDIVRVVNPAAVSK
ncbi:MAG: hypothetical protein WCC11_11590, partial [Gammaproteobacteria bacterium]